MIGLKRDTVQVVDHDPAWARAAADAVREVERAASHLIVDVQHVGSTAVPGLPAKPVLDLVAGVRSLDSLGDLIGKLTATGYAYRGTESVPGEHLFQRDAEPGVRTIHLHVVAHGGAEWQSYLRFRDILREDPVLRGEYAELKRTLARRFPEDRDSYTAAKAEFVRGALDRRR